MNAPPPVQAVPPECDPGDAANALGNRFLASIETIQGVLSSQEKSFAALQHPAPRSESRAKLAPLLAFMRRNSPEQLMELMCLLLDEVAQRQTALDRAIASLADRQLTIDAVTAVAHRIRTELDLALICSEEVAEIASDGKCSAGVEEAASECAHALKLTVRHVGELSELVSFGLGAERRTIGAFSPAEMMLEVLARLNPIARAQGADLVFNSPTHAIMVKQDRRKLHQCLQYLVLAALDSKPSTKVTCSFRVDAGRLFVIVEDDGSGAPIEARAASILSGVNQEEDAPAAIADAAGYAMARRLARSLGGAISLEMWDGKGTRAIVHLPVEQ